MQSYFLKLTRKSTPLLVVVASSLLLFGWASTDWSGALSEGHFRDNPPLAHTGGFGEPTCETCHFGAAVNQTPGALTIAGLPPVYHADSTYAITVKLGRPELVAGGFQLSVRDSTGRQLGELRSAAGGVHVETDSTGVQYAYHTVGSSTPIAADSTRWPLLWIAPERSTADAVLSVVANAADGDNSQFGDVIYQREIQVPAH